MKLPASGPLILVFLSVALPPLSPFVAGPSPHVPAWLLGCLCIALLLVALTRSAGRTVAIAWLFAAVVSALFGLVQYLGWAHVFSPWISAADSGQAYANLRQRNQLATLTNMGIAALLWVLADRWRAHRASLTVLQRSMVVAVLALLVSGQAATASRIGFLQLILMVVLAACWRGDERRRVVGLGLAAVAGYVFAALTLPRLLFWATDVAAPNVFARLSNPQGCESRRVLWANVLQLIAERPWTGWGWGGLDYAHYATVYESERFCDILDNAHNLPLHLAVELGLPMALLACGALVWLVLRAAPWRAEKPLARLAWTVLAVISLHSLVEYPLWYPPFFTAAGLCIVILWSDGRPLLPDPSKRNTLFAAMRLLVALVLVATVLHAWRDYHRVSQLYVPFAERSTEMKERSGQVLRELVWFRDPARFATLTTTALTPLNAADMADSARGLLHYSPEPRVIELLIESLTLLGQDEEALWHLARYRAAFPKDYASWSARNRAAGDTAPASSASGRPETP